MASRGISDGVNNRFGGEFTRRKEYNRRERRGEDSSLRTWSKANEKETTDGRQTRGAASQAAGNWSKLEEDSSWEEEERERLDKNNFSSTQ